MLRWLRRSLGRQVDEILNDRVSGVRGPDAGRLHTAQDGGCRFSHATRAVTDIHGRGDGFSCGCSHALATTAAYPDGYPHADGDACA